MAQQIWKFHLPWEGAPPTCQVSMPPSARVVEVGMQGTGAFVWAVVEPCEPEDHVLRTFFLVPTGPPGFADHLHYFGTYHDSPYVWHVFGWEEEAA